MEMHAVAAAQRNGLAHKRSCAAAVAAYAGTSLSAEEVEACTAAACARLAAGPSTPAAGATAAAAARRAVARAAHSGLPRSPCLDYRRPEVRQARLGGLQAYRCGSHLEQRHLARLPLLILHVCCCKEKPLLHRMREAKTVAVPRATAIAAVRVCLLLQCLRSR
jgi:hypothetical protein